MPRKERGDDQPRKTLAEVKEELRSLWQAWEHRRQRGSAQSAEPAKVGAAYIRESHKDSIQGLSPTSQLGAILDDASRSGITIPWEHVYIDNVTGKHDRRPDFLTCLEAARERAFKSISFFHSSRMFRNVGLAKRYKKELRDRGIAERSADDPVMRVLQRLEVGELLALLSERQRTIVVAHYYLGLSQEEIAKALGLRRGTVSATVSQSLARMRREGAEHA